MTNQLPITNVVNVSVSEANLGVSNYNTSNLALFTRETPDPVFSAGYKIYLEPTEVATDFGSSSETYKMALGVFSQQPNILAGDGYLVVIPFTPGPVVAVQHVAFSTVPATGTYKLKYGGAGETTALAHNASAATVQTALRLISGLASVTVAGDYTAGLDVTFTGVSGPATLLTADANSLQDSAPLNVELTITTTTAGTTSTETLGAAITRTKNLVQYFGILAVEVTGDANTAAAAAVVQALNKIAFFMSRTEADIASGGTLDDLRTGGFTQSRGLYYGTDTDSKLLVMAASYAGRALSTDFTGSNTTSTMHLKTLIGVLPDPTITQTILTTAVAAGADTYISLQGDPVVFCSGENQFFDQVYNLRWFVGALQVAGFNYLAQTGTKVPQTELGMDGLKGAYRSICTQAVSNAYSAPGTWNSATSFGPGTSLLQNVAQQGFYIYSTPIATQTQAVRVTRVAPLVQIALKEAGAIQKSNVVVNVNP